MLYFTFVISALSLKLPPSNLRRNYATTAANYSLQAWCKHIGCVQPFTPNSCLSWCDWNEDKQDAAEEAGILIISAARAAEKKKIADAAEQAEKDKKEKEKKIADAIEEEKKKAARDEGFGLEMFDKICAKTDKSTQYWFMKNIEKDGKLGVNIEVPDSVKADATTKKYAPACDTCYTLATRAPMTPTGTTTWQRHSAAFFKWFKPSAGGSLSSVTLYRWRAALTDDATRCHADQVINSFSPEATDAAGAAFKNDGKGCHPVDVQFGACAAEAVKQYINTRGGMAWPKCSKADSPGPCTSIKMDAWSKADTCGKKGGFKFRKEWFYIPSDGLKASELPEMKGEALQYGKIKDAHMLKHFKLLCAENVRVEGFPHFKMMQWRHIDKDGKVLADWQASQGVAVWVAKEIGDGKENPTMMMYGINDKASYDLFIVKDHDKRVQTVLSKKGMLIKAVDTGFGNWFSNAQSGDGKACKKGTKKEAGEQYFYSSNFVSPTDATLKAKGGDQWGEPCRKTPVFTGAADVWKFTTNCVEKEMPLGGA